MKKKNDTKILKFPSTSLQVEREIEAILFSADEPLDLETIKSRMKSVTIKVGDYDIETIKKIFENEKAFEPRDPRDELIVEVLRQVVDNPKVDLGRDDDPKSE